ncbi:unnamed protein product [Clonostachys chloroleuca]|uniref:SGNH hydrolase-type esterase domain-containing protein n=1 Tax=Clonostachys chloroleuca TaxID=1926264 RepID=A0AA35PW25_9HYPO|nr:unnamed protein product [Clonostachys chloroleuca]
MVSFNARSALVALTVVLSSFTTPSAAVDIVNLRLRILPLGDSITKGSGSSTVNGYRGPLRDKLTEFGASVDMIGTLRNGNMKDNNHEGHSGEYLGDIKNYWQKPMQARPNVVLIHAGTNNMDKEVDLDTAPQLITGIIDGIFDAASDVTVLVAPVIWANDARMQRNTDAFNAKLAQIVVLKQQAGKHILLTPIPISSTADLSDKKHPNNAGYAKFADAWYLNIREAVNRGWVKDAVKVDASKITGVGLGQGGSSGGSYAGCDGGNWSRKGRVFTPSKGLSSDEVVRFADLDGDGKDDIVFVDGKGKARAWLNEGLASWKSLGEIAPGLDEDLSKSRIEFADVNGDKKDDFLVIYGGGAVKAYLNNGNLPKTSDERIWKQAVEISPGVGEPGSKVHFADLNKDGFDDYLIIYDGGAVKAYLNNKNIPDKDKGRFWQEGYTVATGVGQPGSKVRFADITGDGAAEYLIQYDGGAAKGYHNTGNIPNAGKPRNWVAMGTIAGGVGDQGPVSYADLDGDGKEDYLVVRSDGSVDAWINSCEWNPGEPNVGDGGAGDPNIGQGDPSQDEDEDEDQGEGEDGHKWDVTEGDPFDELDPDNVPEICSAGQVTPVSGKYLYVPCRRFVKTFGGDDSKIEGCCVVYTGETRCKKWAKSLADEAVDSISVMDRQATKDGATKSTSKDNWHASFLLGTSAIPNRDVVPAWTKAMIQWDQKYIPEQIELRVKTKGFQTDTIWMYHECDNSANEDPNDDTFWDGFLDPDDKDV